MALIKLTRSRRRPWCPICGTQDCTCPGEHEYTGKGEKAIVMPNALGQGTGKRRSGVFATDRIYEKTEHGRRLLYAKGSEIKPEDLVRLGFREAEPSAEVEPVKTTPKRGSRKPAAAKKPATTKPTPKARGHRARRPATPKEDA